MPVTTSLFYGVDNIVGVTSLQQIFTGLFTPQIDIQFTGEPDQARIDDDEGDFDDFFGTFGQVQDPGMNQTLTEDLVINGQLIASAGQMIFNAGEAEITNLTTGEVGRLIYVTIDGGDDVDFVGVVATIPLNNADTFRISNSTVIGTEPFANIVCFTPGAMIETGAGRRRIEEVEVGDLIETADHGLQPVRLIIKRDLGREALAAQPALSPVLIRKDAFGPNTPDADMRVSPQHRMWISGWRAELLFGEAEVLAPAVSLIDDRAVLRDNEAETVTYIHLVFDRHEIVTVNNAPSESLFPGAEAMEALADEQREEIERIFPYLDVDTPMMARPAIRAFEAQAVRGA